MNSGNSNTSDIQRLLLNLSDKINFKKSNKCVALSLFRVFYAWNHIKKSHKNNKLEISVPKWIEHFELPDGSNFVLFYMLYYLLYYHDYFEYIIKKHGKLIDNPPLRIYVNKIGLHLKLKQGIVSNF